MPKKTKKKQTKRPNAAIQIADRILEKMEAGELPPWDKGWAASPYGVPFNAVTNRPYRGVNVLALALNAYSDPRWLTFKQAKAAGGSVCKGEKSTMVVFWKFPSRDEETLEDDISEDHESKDEKDADSKEHKLAVLCRGYNVFNVEQTTGCDLPELEMVDEDYDPIEQAEAIVKNMPNTPPILHELSSNEAPYYSPTKDEIHIPHPNRFKTLERYYNTLYHELVHSTGHSTRLNRLEEEGWKYSTDIHERGKEEMVAGIGQAMLCAMVGISRQREEELMTNTSSYIKHWMRTIKEDKSIVMRSAQAAQKAVDYIVQRQAVLPIAA